MHHGVRPFPHNRKDEKRRPRFCSWTQRVNEKEERIFLHFTFFPQTPSRALSPSRPISHRSLYAYRETCDALPMSESTSSAAAAAAGAASGVAGDAFGDPTIDGEVPLRKALLWGMMKHRHNLTAALEDLSDLASEVASSALGVDITHVAPARAIATFATVHLFVHWFKRHFLRALAGVAKKTETQADDKIVDLFNAEGKGWLAGSPIDPRGGKGGGCRGEK